MRCLDQRLMSFDTRKAESEIPEIGRLDKHYPQTAIFSNAGTQRARVSRQVSAAARRDGSCTREAAN
jgi:hypothetical protein